VDREVTVHLSSSARVIVVSWRHALDPACAVLPHCAVPRCEAAEGMSARPQNRSQAAQAWRAPGGDPQAGHATMAAIPERQSRLRQRPCKPLPLKSIWACSR
jgi:hypothetical protein